MGLGFSNLIGDGCVGLIGLFWVSVGLRISSLCGFDQVFLGFRGGVDLISFLWVSKGLGFSCDGGGVCCFGKWV